MDLDLGTEFAGHRIERVIGRGGASVVYLAEHLRLGRKVALKVLASHLAEDNAFRERFIRESRIAAGLDHPNIVPVYDAGEVEGILYISMRHVVGSDLGRLLRAEGPIEATRAVLILSQVAEALDAAHLQELVHRDVKPANVLIEALEGVVDRAYLSDFGISKRTTTGAGLTRTGQFVDTADYVSPEQITGESVDGRTDVYSLGCVLFHCLSGRVPFPGEIEVATIYSQLHDSPPSLAGLVEAAEGLDRVLAKALAKAKEDRYQTCSELVEAARIELIAALSPSASVQRTPAFERDSSRGSRSEIAVANQSPRPKTPPRREPKQPRATSTPSGPALDRDIETQVRKVVTVLFCDVVGSTSLSERLDPESLRDVMGRYFETVRTCIERHGGTVEKFIGDAVMAVFGVPVAREDDALRAVRAASELPDALAGLSGELEQSYGVRLQIRTGVNTGDVVAGDSSSGQSFVSGDAVNVAARLEQTARPGETLLGGDTLRLVRDAVKTEAVQPLSLKGKAEPVRAFRLLEVVQGAPAFTRRLDSPMVGRDAELQQLLDAAARTERERRCELVTVLGEAGLGKSRLTLELASRLAEKARVLEGRCLPYGEGITFWPVAEMVRRAAGIEERDTRRDSLDKIGELLQGVEGADAELILDRVAGAIGLDEAQGALQETFWAARRLLEVLADAQPLMAVFEDIHWAEPTLLDLIEYIAGLSRGHPLLLLCTARPELREARPDWGRGGSLVSLTSLGAADSERLIDNLLGRSRLPQGVGDQVVHTAEGNPLFVEEMLHMLIDEGSIREDNGAWVAVGDISRVDVPRTIQALIASRLDHLEDEERAVMQRASIAGQVFYWGAVTELSPDEARATVGGYVQTLLRKEMIEPEESPFAGEDAFRFKHILVRDAAYASIPKRTRAGLHERFASWLERVSGDRLREYAEIVAYHLEEAHRYLAELGATDDRGRDLADRASVTLARSGTAALGRGDLQAAQNLLSRALELVAPDSGNRASLLADLSAALEGAGRFEEAGAALEEARVLAHEAGDPVTGALATIRKARLSAQLAYAANEVVLADVQAMVPGLEALGDDRALAEAWSTVGLLQFAGGSDDAEAALERSVRHARAAGDHRTELLALRTIASVIADGSTPAKEAMARLPELHERAEGSKVTEAWMAMHLCLLYAMGGRIEEARTSWRRSVDICEELGERMFAAATSMYLGWAEMIAGDPARAEGPMREAAATLERAGEKGWLSTVAAVLAEVLWRQGKAGEAERFAGLSREAALPDDWMSQMQWRAPLAKVLVDRGGVEQAEALAREAVEAIDRTDYIKNRGDARASLAYVLRAGGRRDEAAAVLREALELYERKGDVADAAAARAQLEALSRN